MDDPDQLPGFDTSKAHAARVYDYWLGGRNNFEADRRAAQRAIRDYPGIRRGVREQRAFLQRAVTYLAHAGVRQFLDVGSGIPGKNNTHEIAQAVAAECRVVYADNDPVVLAHARALLDSGGRTAFVPADLRATDALLSEAEGLLDFDQPVAIMLIGVLQLIPDDDDPHGIVRRLLAAVPSGSWLAIAQPTQEVLADQVTKMASRLNKDSATPATLRTHAEISRFFEGTALVEPGVVQLHRWRPLTSSGPGEEVPAYCGLGRKP